MPLELEDPDGDDFDPAGRPRANGPRTPWWRPASTTGRVFLGLAALLVLGALGASAFLLKSYIGRDSRFRIAGTENIEATGLTEVSRAEMLPVFGEDIGRNVFFVPLSERRKQLEQIPWVEHATVMRLLPDQIRVQLVERTPVAFTRQGHEIGLVDSSGILLTMPPAMMAQHHYSFPILTGIDPRDPLTSRRERMAVYGHLLQELDSTGQRLSMQISEVDLTDPEDARVTMQDDNTLLHFGEDHFIERYQTYRSRIAEWHQQYPKLAAVDLRYDHQAVLEMTPGTNAVAAALGDPAPPATDNAKPTPSQPAEIAQAKPSPAPTAAVAQDKQPLDNPEKDKPAHTKSPETSAKVNAPEKPAQASASRLDSAGGLSAAARALTAKDKAAKAARDKKKRTEAKRATLNASKRKTASTHPAANAAQGQ
ncbi:MAG: FtsQ-type POTRA domain-containing protein [Terracidiphilus sp.]|jgi:cell division protein FtsQ